MPGSETVNEGTYTFSVFANGTANNGETFARETQYSVFVGIGTSVNAVGSDNPQFIHLPLITK